MIKKINTIFALFLLANCTIADKPLERGGFYDSSQDGASSRVDFGEAENFKVAMLLPLSGSTQVHGQGLKNAALMALEDVDNPNMMLQFYDTGSSSHGAKDAVDKAIAQRSNLIIGPLTSDEVKAISPQAQKRRIPVITFSTNYDVLDKGVYSLGLLTGEQINRIVSFAAQKGRKNLAILVPDNNTGLMIVRESIISAQNHNINITKIAFYPPDTQDFAPILQKIANYEERSVRAKKTKASLAVKANAGDKSASNALKRLERVETIGGVDFDAILIPEYGNRLKAITAMLEYYDAAEPTVKLLGTSIWEGSKLTGEGSLVGAWYPSLSRSHNDYFIRKYQQTFDEAPRNIYSFAYDAVALASVITNSKSKNIDAIITNSDGYSGINGVFRIFVDGTNQHSLDIMEVRNNNEIVIDKAPKRLSSDYYHGLKKIVISEDYRAPMIIGKDTTNAQYLIYGKELPPRNQPSYYDTRTEEEIIREDLRRRKIIN